MYLSLYYIYHNCGGIDSINVLLENPEYHKKRIYFPYNFFFFEMFKVPQNFKLNLQQNSYKIMNNNFNYYLNYKIFRTIL